MSRRLKEDTAKATKPLKGTDKPSSKPPKLTGKDNPGDILFYTKKMGAGTDREEDAAGGSVMDANDDHASAHAGHQELEQNSEHDWAECAIDPEEGDPQPSLRQILKAVHVCTASVNTVNDRLGGLSEEVALMRQDFQKMRERTTAAESRISDLEDQLPPLVADTRAVTRLAHENKDKTDDLENRLRRNNVRIVGLPEKAEGREPTEFIEHWLLDVFGKDSFTPLFAVERAHRVPARAQPGNAPRSILARLLHYRDREKILRLARERSNIKYNGHNVSFYPDFSPDVQKQRAKFYNIKQRLRGLGLPYAMLYPARLRVTANGRALFFNTAGEAADWLDVHEPALRNRPRVEEEA